MPTLAQAGSAGFDLDSYLDGYLFSREELKRALSLVQAGNDYRFDLVRAADGWRIRGWVPRIRWGYGDEASYDAGARQAAWHQA